MEQSFWFLSWPPCHIILKRGHSRPPSTSWMWSASRRSREIDSVMSLLGHGRDANPNQLHQRQTLRPLHQRGSTKRLGNIPFKVGCLARRGCEAPQFWIRCLLRWCLRHTSDYNKMLHTKWLGNIPLKVGCLRRKGCEASQFWTGCLLRLCLRHTSDYNKMLRTKWLGDISFKLCCLTREGCGGCHF